MGIVQEIKIKKLLGIAIIFLLLSAVSYGQLVAIQIEATVKTITDRDNLLEGNIAIGSTITGTYTYDTSVSDTNPFSWAGEYFNYSSLCGINLSSGNFSFQTNSTNTKFLIGVIDNYLNSPEDHYVVRSYNNLSLSNGIYVDHISWSLSDYTGTAISSVILPTTAPIMSDWSWNTLSISGGTGGTAPCYDKIFFITAHVTSAVLIPEPISILVFGFGLLVLRKQK